MDEILAKPAKSQTLAKARGYLRAAQDFLRGELDRDGLHEALDIGLPGVDYGK